MISLDEYHQLLANPHRKDAQLDHAPHKVVDQGSLRPGRRAALIQPERSQAQCPFCSYQAVLGTTDPTTFETTYQCLQCKEVFDKYGTPSSREG